MRPAPSLLQRFTRTPSSGYPRDWAEVDSYEFYIETPAKLDSLIELGKSQIRENQSQSKRIVAAIDSGREEFAGRLVAEIEHQTAQISDSISCGADLVSGSIQEIGSNICAHLDYIVWTLQQVSGKLEELIYNQRKRRSVEATELLSQATQHMIAKNIHEAHNRLSLAYDLDSTDYEILFNLGVVHLHLQNPEQAIQFFDFAARVPANLTAEAKARATFNKARVYFANGDPKNAYEVIQECLSLRTSARDSFYASIYAFHSRNQAGAKNHLISAIINDTSHFAMAAIHEELNDFRDVVLNILFELDDLAQSHYLKSVINFNQLRKSVLDDVLKLHGIPEFSESIVNPKGRTVEEIAKLGFSERAQFIATVDQIRAYESECNALLEILKNRSAEQERLEELENKLNMVHEETKIKSNGERLTEFVNTGFGSALSPVIGWLSVGIVWFLGCRLIASSLGQTDTIFNSPDWVIYMVGVAILWPLIALGALLTALMTFIGYGSSVGEVALLRAAALWFLASVPIVFYSAQALLDWDGGKKLVLKEHKRLSAERDEFKLLFFNKQKRINDITNIIVSIVTDQNQNFPRRLL